MTETWGCGGRVRVMGGPVEVWRGSMRQGPAPDWNGFPVNIPAQLEKRLLHFCVFLFRLPDGAEHGAAKRFFPVKECVPVVEAVEGSEFSWMTGIFANP